MVTGAVVVAAGTPVVALGEGLTAAVVAGAAEHMHLRSECHWGSGMASAAHVQPGAYSCASPLRLKARCTCTVQRESGELLAGTCLRATRGSSLCLAWA